MTLGLAKSGFYPGMQYIIGSWYRKDELAKRSCIFYTSSALATMFSEYLLTAALQLDGRGGFAGRQWYAHELPPKRCAALTKLSLVAF
jgi:MFS transporter, ACS family, pantothenate transporter